MIIVENLTKYYGKHKAIENLNFTIEKGKITGFLGPNGAGKSTTMNIITGYLAASSGRVLIDGFDVMTDGIEAKALIGYLSEQPSLYLDLTVNEYIHFLARLRKVSAIGLKNDKEKIYQMLSLGDVQDRLIKNLSKGYRQRVGFGGALVGSPPLLVLDEPTVGLDPKQIIELRTVIKTLQNDHTILLSSHILPEVQALCDQALIINHGHIVACDSPSNLSRKLMGSSQLEIKVISRQADLEKQLSRIDEIGAIEQLQSDEEGTLSYRLSTKSQNDIRVITFDRLKKLDVDLLAMKSYDLSLEDVFLQLTTKEELD